MGRKKGGEQLTINFNFLNHWTPKMYNLYERIDRMQWEKAQLCMDCARLESRPRSYMSDHMREITRLRSLICKYEDIIDGLFAELYEEKSKNGY